MHNFLEVAAHIPRDPAEPLAQQPGVDGVHDPAEQDEEEKTAVAPTRGKKEPAEDAEADYEPEVADYRGESVAHLVRLALCLLGLGAGCGACRWLLQWVRSCRNGWSRACCGDVVVGIGSRDSSVTAGRSISELRRQWERKTSMQCSSKV
jgi:hypothetical protein